MVNIKTNSGFSVKVNEDVFDDMRFLSLLRKTEENPIFIDDMARAMMGDDNVEKLYKHLENEDKRVPVSVFSAEIEEIMTQVGQKVKKS